MKLAGLVNLEEIFLKLNDCDVLGTKFFHGTNFDVLGTNFRHPWYKFLSSLVRILSSSLVQILSTSA